MPKMESDFGCVMCRGSECVFEKVVYVYILASGYIYFVSMISVIMLNSRVFDMISLVAER